MNLDLLSWFSNLINFLIFLYISINIVSTSCFDTFQMSLSLFGLLSSIFVQIVSVTIKKFGGN